MLKDLGVKRSITSPQAASQTASQTIIKIPRIVKKISTSESSMESIASIEMNHLALPKEEGKSITAETGKTSSDWLNVNSSFSKTFYIRLD